MEPSDKGGGQGLGNCYSPVPKRLPVLKRASSCCERFGSHSAEELGNRAAGTAGPVTLSEATSFASRSALLCPRAVAVSPFLTSPAMRDRHCLRGPRSLWELKDLFSILYVSPPESIRPFSVSKAPRTWREVKARLESGCVSTCTSAAGRRAQVSALSSAFRAEDPPGRGFVQASWPVSHSLDFPTGRRRSAGSKGPEV